ncbi:MAG: twin-arginine translocation signal domain-containing protein [Planctomycetota bacterium]|nr:twin-arginine translocation signal domain-containing protein [Planctomycetota bacterium]
MPRTVTDQSLGESAALEGRPGPSRGLTRRQFLKRAAVVGGVAAAPLVVAASVLGRGGTVSPSERIVAGG